MKTFKKLLLCLCVAAIAACTFALVGCGESKEPPKDERITYTQENNVFREWTPADFNAMTLHSWEEKRDKVGVAYEFEGSYTEGYQDMVDPTYFDAYLYNDGSVRATNVGGATSSNPLYGYWFNIDEYGDECLTIQWVSIGAEKYTRQSVATKFDGGDYDWQSNVTRDIWGSARTTLIYGRNYKKTTGLEINTDKAKTSYVPGEALNTNDIVVYAVKEDGSKVKIRTARCTFENDFSEPGKDIPVKVIFEKAEGTFNVYVKKVVELKLTTDDVEKEYNLGDKISTTGLKVSAKYDDDSEADIDLENCKITGSATKAGEFDVKVAYGGAEASYKVNVKGIDYTGTAKVGKEVKDVKISRTSASEASVTIDGTTFDCFCAASGAYESGDKNKPTYLVLWGIENETYKGMTPIFEIGANKTLKPVEYEGLKSYHGTDRIYGNEWFQATNYHFYLISENQMVIAMERVDDGNFVFWLCGYELRGMTLTVSSCTSSTDSGGTYWFGVTGDGNPNSFNGVVFYKTFTLNDEDGTAKRK